MGAGMTGSRVLVAIVVILLGFGLWGLHRELGYLTETTVALGTNHTKHLEAMSTKLDGHGDKIDKLYKLTYGKATIHRPIRAKKPIALPPQPTGWGWFPQPPR